MTVSIYKIDLKSLRGSIPYAYLSMTRTRRTLAKRRESNVDKGKLLDGMIDQDIAMASEG